MSDASHRLRAAREAAGYRFASQAAKALNVGESAYRSHENGQNDFTSAQARLYGAAFGVDPMWLMFGSSHEASVQRLIDLLISKGVITKDDAQGL